MWSTKKNIQNYHIYLERERVLNKFSIDANVWALNFKIQSTTILQKCVKSIYRYIN